MASRKSKWDKYKGPIVVGTGASAVSLLLWGIFRNKGAGGTGTEPAISAPAQHQAGTEIEVAGINFDPNEPVAVAMEGDQGAGTAVEADAQGSFVAVFMVPSHYSGERVIAAAGLTSGKTAETSTVVVSGNGTGGEITEATFPWGADVQSLGMASGFDLDIWGDENSDIRFHIVDTGVPEGEDHYYLIRTFDPTGLHVKDYVAQMSDTLRQRIDPTGARINNVTEPCTLCDYQPGTWTFHVLGSPNVRFVQDVTRPLKYDHFSSMGTAETEGKTVEDMGVFTLVVS